MANYGHKVGGIPHLICEIVIHWGEVELVCMENCPGCEHEVPKGHVQYLPEASLN